MAYIVRDSRNFFGHAHIGRIARSSYSSIRLSKPQVCNKVSVSVIAQLCCCSVCLLLRFYRAKSAVLRTFELFWTVPSPNSNRLLFPKIGVCNPTQNFNRYYLRNGQSYTDFKFGRYIYGVHPKSPLKFLRKGSVGVSRECPIFGYPNCLRTGKATNFKFCKFIHRIDRNKCPLTISRKVAMGLLRDSKIFRAPIYRAHRAVILAIAQLSCLSTRVTLC